jgi:hypothetical protein
VFDNHQRCIDVFLWHEQLHTSCSAFHSQTDTDNDNDSRHASGVQRDLCQIGVDSRRVGLDGLHDGLDPS